MPRPFNFFQFSESGITGSGIVAAYKDFFTGFFTPTGWFTQQEGYITDWGEYIDSRGNVPFYNVTINGEVPFVPRDDFGISSLMSGNFYPLLSEPSFMSTSFTGLMTGEKPDISYYSLNVTGKIDADNLDINNYNLKVYGKVLRHGKDIPSLSLQITGEQNKGYFNTPTYSLILSGNIIKYEKDPVSLLAEVDSMSWLIGFPKIKEDYFETGNLLIDVDYMSWT